MSEARERGRSSDLLALEKRMGAEEGLGETAAYRKELPGGARSAVERVALAVQEASREHTGGAPGTEGGPGLAEAGSRRWRVVGGGAQWEEGAEAILSWLQGAMGTENGKMALRPLAHPLLATSLALLSSPALALTQGSQDARGNTTVSALPLAPSQRALPHSAGNLGEADIENPSLGKELLGKGGFRGEEGAGRRQRMRAQAWSVVQGAQQADPEGVAALLQELLQEAGMEGPKSGGAGSGTGTGEVPGTGTATEVSYAKGQPATSARTKGPKSGEAKAGTGGGSGSGTGRGGAGEVCGTGNGTRGLGSDAKGQPAVSAASGTHGHAGLLSPGAPLSPGTPVSPGVSLSTSTGEGGEPELVGTGFAPGRSGGGDRERGVAGGNDRGALYRRLLVELKTMTP